MQFTPFKYDWQGVVHKQGLVQDDGWFMTFIWQRASTSAAGEQCAISTTNERKKSWLSITYQETEFFSIFNVEIEKLK